MEMRGLERKRVRLQVFSYSSFGNVPGGNSQIGYVIVLVDKRGGKYPLAWKSKIGKKVERSGYRKIVKAKILHNNCLLLF